jgi:diguanylate cyclase (GGDEF)-like protein
MSTLSFRVFESTAPPTPCFSELTEMQPREIAQLHQELDNSETELRRLRQAAVRDAITGGANMRALQMAWEGQDSEDPCSLLMIDIDGFRRVNQSLGRANGDAVLKAVTTTLERELRWDDVVAREGADRFIVLLPLAIEEDAFAVAERLRVAVQKLCFQVEQGRFKLTIRAGAASRREDDSLETLIGRSDKACRDGKSCGGNIIFFE